MQLEQPVAYAYYNGMIEVGEMPDGNWCATYSEQSVTDKESFKTAGIGRTKMAATDRVKRIVEFARLCDLRQ